MYPTRRLWAIVGLAVLLAVLATVFARPLLFVGTVLIGAWVLSRQYLFYRAVATVTDDLTVTQSPARDWLQTNETTPVTLAARLDQPSPLVCTLRGGLPPTATTSVGTQLEIAITPGMTNAELTADIHWPVAGRHTFRQPTLTVCDGLFEQSLQVGPMPSLTVEPRGPRDIHVGEGGEQTPLAYGQHDAGRLGSGIEPAELREYVVGDTVDRIDWNATARFKTPHVREYEAETDRQTLLVVDHRSSLAEGPAAERKLAYLREVALAITESANRLDDPLGLLSVGDRGITTQIEPATTPDHYATVRRTLLELEPTTDDDVTSSTALSTSPLSGVTETRQTMRDIRQSVTALETSDGAFAQTLQPLYADRQQYRKQLDDEPLFTAVKSALAHQPNELLTVLCTDDSDPVELRETVTVASRGSGSVLVLLAPSILYKSGGLTDLEQGYQRYLDFEEFRRSLASLDGVMALEVGPNDRLSAILAAGQNRRSRQSVGGEPS